MRTCLPASAQILLLVSQLALWAGADRSTGHTSQPTHSVAAAMRCQLQFQSPACRVPVLPHVAGGSRPLRPPCSQDMCSISAPRRVAGLMGPGAGTPRPPRARIAPQAAASAATAAVEDKWWQHQVGVGVRDTAAQKCAATRGACDEVPGNTHGPSPAFCMAQADLWQDVHTDEEFEAAVSDARDGRLVFVGACAVTPPLPPLGASGPRCMQACPARVALRRSPSPPPAREPPTQHSMHGCPRPTHPPRALATPRRLLRHLVRRLQALLP
jgi:hypothetical protein